MFAGVAAFHFKVQSISWLHDHFIALAFSAIVYSFLLAVYLYATSFMGKRVLADGGNTGSAIYDFFIGRELNPRLGAFDWKFFCELRPGLVGWAVLNAAFAVKQYELTGAVSPSMILVNLFQFYYVFDAMLNESSILTTMDITTDGFGFMLAFGDLAWVPFMYSLQCRYLVYHSPSLPVPALVGIFALHTLGLWIFRGANSQKDTFRSKPTDPSVAGLSYIQTEVGTRLLTAGWWGKSRHINYFGDWCMGVSWCLPCGASTSLVPVARVYTAVVEHCSPR